MDSKTRVLLFLVGDAGVHVEGEARCSSASTASSAVDAGPGPASASHRSGAIPRLSAALTARLLHGVI